MYRIVSTIAARGNKYYAEFNSSTDRAIRVSKPRAPTFDKEMAEKILAQLRARDNAHEWELEECSQG